MRIGLTELVIIVLLVVAFFSPDQLKSFSAKLGRSIKAYRESMDTLSEPIKEVKQTVDDIKKEVNDAVILESSKEQQDISRKEE